MWINENDQQEVTTNALSKQIHYPKNDRELNKHSKDVVKVMIIYQGTKY